MASDEVKSDPELPPSRFGSCLGFEMTSALRVARLVSCSLQTRQSFPKAFKIYQTSQMDKFTSIAKGGWHPPGDRAIRKDSWKSDLKGLASGKKKDPYEYARNHQSAPLFSLKDPDSFGPPPKHYTNGQPPLSAAVTAARPQAQRYEEPTGGLGSIVPAPSRKQEAEEAEESKPKPPPVPFRADTSGLRTDHLPKPPVRRADGSSSPANATPYRATLPARHTPALPARSGPAPVLPPRQNEYPDEHTPAPPPPYTEAAKQPAGLINQAASARLGQAGISVPGFNIESQSNTNAPTTAPHASSPQISELQQRFSRMNTASRSYASSSLVSSNGSDISALTAVGKTPPPPPPKKVGLAQQTTGSTGRAPPPLPLSSKPRPS